MAAFKLSEAYRCHSPPAQAISQRTFCGRRTGSEDIGEANDDAVNVSELSSRNGCVVIPARSTRGDPKACTMNRSKTSY